MGQDRMRSQALPCEQVAEAAQSHDGQGGLERRIGWKFLPKLGEAAGKPQNRGSASTGVERNNWSRVLEEWR
jgi:hypothetical protein